jgi:glycosyltransferase involved in cell wall biosynthesis
MRALFDHQIFSFQSRGGVSRYFVELGTRLAAQDGIDLRVAAGWHRNLLLRENPAGWIQGRYIRHFPMTLRLRCAVNSLLTRQEIRKWRPDVVHETYFRAGATYQAGLATVITVYDLIYFVLNNNSDAEARVRKDQAAAILRADGVVCISESTRRDLLRYISVDPERVRVIPLAGTPKRRFRDPISSQPDIDGPFILYVGIRHGYKNFDLLLRVLSELQRIHASHTLVAFGGGAFTDAESTRLRSLGLNPERIVHRSGDDMLLEAYYSRASAFICPSLYEGFGLPILEAMSNGCPVICSDRGSLREVAGNAALFFDPADASGLAKALEAVIGSKILAADLRARGVQQAAMFSWDRCAEQTLAMYQDIIHCAQTFSKTVTK